MFRPRYVLALVGVALLAQPPDDYLLRNFQNPPDSARPRAWWHWMNGNITKEGITADLEWMKRAGFAGLHNFDDMLNTPQIVEKRLVFMRPEWKDAFRHAATLADKLGLEMAIGSSPGLSESGGPWVPTEQAMKKYVWGETRVEGGRPFTGVLPKPPSATGTYQNLDGARAGAPEFYADVAVVAFRVSESDRTMTELQAKVTSSAGSFDVAALTGGDLSKTTLLPAAPAGEKAWIQYEFPRPQTFRGVTFIDAATIGIRLAHKQLEVSDDGMQFRVVAELPYSVLTVAFPAVTARYFRVTVRYPPPSSNVIRFAGPQIAQFLLHKVVVNQFQDKAGFMIRPGTMATAPVPVADVVRKSGVIVLTSRLRSDGTLRWTPPAGRWVILRIGYSLTGHQNWQAPREATGLEVDKLNRTYVRNYFNPYLDLYKDATGGLMGRRGVHYVVTDNWLAGPANWTDNMLAEFARRRGYGMKRWLPVLAGRIVESAEASDRFLWDFRRTLSEMDAEYHHGQLTKILKERGMAHYTGSDESGHAFIGDGIKVKRTAAIPMSVRWISPLDRTIDRYDADIRESASVAHIYGQNLVAAELLTAGGLRFSLETLKPAADREMSMGLNRFLIHASHQPVNDKIPGLGLVLWGEWFTRHETWAEQAKPWTTYLARSCYMLQQGQFVADIAYYGEDSNITELFGGAPRPIPAGYNFDYVNSDVIKNRLKVGSDGTITTPTGMRYRVLALDPNARHMPLAVLRKIRDMVKAGAVVVGPKPIDSPSLADKQSKFKRIADRLWAGGERSIPEALARLKVPADFDTRSRSPTRSWLLSTASWPMVRFIG
jgi:hypothetical protein